MEDSKLRKVYDTIVKEGYDVPDFATFETDMRDDKKLTLVRDRLVEDGYELPDFEQFKIDMFGTPASAPANPTFTAQQLGLKEEAPQNGDNAWGTYKDVGAVKPPVQSGGKETLTTFGEGVKQGADAIYQGNKYFVGEQARFWNGAQQDAKKALEFLDAQGEGFDAKGWDVRKAMNEAAQKQWEKDYEEFLKVKEARRKERKESDMGFWERILHKVADPSMPEPLESRRINPANMSYQRPLLTLNDALKEADGDVAKARAILEKKASEEQWADKTMREASEAMAKHKPVEGAAWWGQMVPQVAGQATAIGASFIPGVGGVLGKVLSYGTTAGLTASSAGQAMAEARQAGASDEEVWSAGVAQAVIEAGSEQIPLNRLIGKTGSAAFKKGYKAIADNIPEKELEKLLVEGNKRLGGKLLSGKTAKELIKDMGVEGASEFVAEFLGTYVPIIYADKESYPTLLEAVKNGWEGAKAGFAMGGFLGGGSTVLSNTLNENRRKKQGFVELANNKDGNVVEVVGEKEGLVTVLTQDGATKDYAPEELSNIGTFSYDEWKNAKVDVESRSIENAFDKGFNEPGVDTGDKLFAAEQEVKTALGLNTEESIEDYMDGRSIDEVAMDDEDLTNKLNDYFKAKAEDEGRRAAIEEQKQVRYAEVDKSIDNTANKDDGMVYSATLPGGETVFITDGTVVLDNEGYIDVNQSRDLIALFPDNSKKAIEAGDIREKIEVSNAQELKDARHAEIDSELSAPKNAFSVNAEDGAHTIEVVEDNGNGFFTIVDNGEQKIIDEAFLYEISGGKFGKPAEGVASVASGNTQQVAENATETAPEAPVASGENVSPDKTTQQQVVAPKVAEVPDFFRLNGKNYTVVSRNEDGSVTVKIDDMQEILPTETDFSAVMPTDKGGNVQFTEMPIERTLEYFVQRVSNGKARAQMIENNRKQAESALKKFDKEPNVGTDPDAYDAAINKWEADKRAAQAKVDYWNEVAKRDAEIQRSEMREAVEAVEAVKPRGVVEKTADEFVASVMPKITPESFKAETGLSNTEQKSLVGIIASAEKGGVTIEQAAESILENYGDELRGLGFNGDMQDMRDIIINILSTGNPRSYAKKGFEMRQQADIEQQMQELESVANTLGFETIDEQIKYEEVVVPSIIQNLEGFDETEYFNNLAENIEYDTTRESEGTRGSSELLQGKQSADNAGATDIAEPEQGGEVQGDVYSGGENATPQGNQQVSSSEIPNSSTGEVLSPVEGAAESGNAPGNSGVAKLSDKDNAPYTIAPAQYTTKKGKVLDMFLLKIPAELNSKQSRVANSLVRSEYKGWWDKEQGGFMMRSEDDAIRFGEYLADLVSQEPVELVSMDDIKAVNDGDVVFTEPKQEDSRIWQYSIHIDADGYTTLSRDDVSGIYPIGDARFRQSTNSPEEMLDILRNPLNGMQDVLEAVGVTLENKIKTRELDRKSKEQVPTAETNPSGNRLVTDERYAELRERMRKKLGGQMNIGIDPEILAIGTEMAVFHLEKGARKFTEYAKAMIADLGDAIRPYLKAFYNGARNLPEVESSEIATDMTPYDEVQTFDIANFDKPGIDAIATAETVTREAEVAQEVEVAQERIKKVRKTKNDNKNSINSQQEQLNLFDNGREENTAADNSGTQLEREELPDTEQVGAGVSVQNTARNSKSKRRNAGVGSSELGNGPQYDVNRNYTNEEIEEIVSSVTDIVDGKVVITGEVTDDIRTIVRGYESGGIAKKGRGILDEYYTDGKIVDAVNMLIAPYFNNTTPVRVLEPSVGIGNFIQAVNNIPTSEVVAFEINETTARIAKILYPDVDVNLRSFETEFIDENGNKKPLPQKYSLVIGNPPYGSHRGLYKGLGEESKIARYEDYFVKRSLDVLDEGGVLAMVLPSSWIDRHTKFGGYTIERAYRLPSGAFEATQVGTDIVILKKDSSVPVTEHVPYFEQFPERVLGEIKERTGRYGRTEEFVEGDIDAAIEAIKKENAEQLADLLDIEKSNDALNNIESAIDEIGSTEKAVDVVKDAQNSEKADDKPATKLSGKQDKYKVELNRGAETVPTSSQFTHEFSEGEVEAFADTDYEGTLSNPTKHKRYANYIGGSAVHDFYYAEGDIYSKLALLEQDKRYIVENYGAEQYEKQKALLESVLPKQKSLEEITISPNTAFVKNLNILTDGERVSLKDMFVDFCRKLPYQAFGSSSAWEVIGYVNNEQVHGTDKQRNQLVRERRKRAANDLFNKFLNEELSDNAKKQVVVAFNREYNSTYRPDYSKVPMFSTINRDFKGKPLKLTSVQLAGIGRMTVKGVGVLAHEVGFGKTLSGILAMHEAMTRGFAKKPLIVVPNDNILKQWVETIGEVLPSATVNTLGNLGAGYDLTDFMVNDGEFTIITYEGLKAMSFSDGTYNHLASKFSYITEDLNKHQSERDIQRAIEKKNELKGKMKRGTKASYMFENFGFDWLTVDEVHNANHIVSKVRLDKSVASDFRSQSQRTSDLGLKTWLAAQYIQEENNGRNVLLLSATPFTNKPLEYYSVLSLVGNDMLERKGFFNVDQFFATFMEADNELEIGANGRPVQKTNVRRFRNNGLFQQLLSEFIDIKGEEDNPELVRPERLNKEYKIAQNELTTEAMTAAQELLSDNDTVLQGIGHARAAAFSPYATSLLGMQPKNHKEFVKNSPKIDATIKMIEQNIKDRPDAGQIIYSEVGVEYFPLIRDYLVKESGLKPGEVRIITGATSNNERVNIQSAFNNGEVKVVIGSPAIKEGLNLQGNTTDMYILSLPWNFTQLRQIEGRGWRQGNKWENIRINYMLTNDSVDVFMLQRLQLKQGLYNEAMKSGAESLDVSDIDTAELKTALITDPAVRAEIVTVQERAKLQQEKTQIEADLSFVMRKYEAYNKLVSKLESQKNTIKMYREWAKKGDEYWAQRVEREEAQLTSIENEIEEEKQNLIKKGVNVDDIVRQTQQSQNDIAAIQEKIDNLKEFQEELTQKFLEESEAKTKEQGDLVSTYIKERKAENKGGFYKIRPVKSENNAVDEDDDTLYRSDDTMYRIREEAAPKNTGIGYKVFVLKNGELYPPMVANPNGEATPVGVWLDADAAPVAGQSKTGRSQVKAGGKGTQGGSGKLAYRPGWHLGEIPYALQFNRNDENGERTLFPANFVWAEVEYANDVDYQEEAMSYGYNQNGKFQHSYAGLPRVPENGAYRYRTNPNPDTDPWIITGAMRVKRLLTPTEVDEIVKAAGREPQRRQEGAITDEQINALNAEIANDYREGGGSITDREVVMDSDPYSKALGRPRYTGKKMGEYVARQRMEMAKRVKALAQKLNLNIDVLESTEGLSGKRVKAKGWYEPKGKRIVVVIPNHTSVNDAVATVLHEAVAHHGLRELFGENFDTFLQNVYNNADADVRKAIETLAAQRYNGNLLTATEEYLASLAENTDFEYATKSGWWERIKDYFFKMLRSLGIEGFGGITLTDNELRYILWRSYQNLANPGMYNNVFGRVKDTAKQYELKVGDYAPAVQNGSMVAGEDIDNSYTELSYEEAQDDIHYRVTQEALDVVNEFNTRNRNTARVIFADGEQDLREQLSAWDFAPEDIEVVVNSYKKGTLASYFPEYDKVLIYKHDVSQKELNGYLWHENAHRAVEYLFSQEEMEEVFLDMAGDKIEVERARLLEDGYEEAEQAEEYIVRGIEEMYLKNPAFVEQNRFKAVEGAREGINRVIPKLKKIIDFIQNGNEEDSTRRGRVGSGLRGDKTEYQRKVGRGDAMEMRNAGNKGGNAQEAATADDTRFRIEENSIDNVPTQPFTFTEKITNSVLEASVRNKENLTQRSEALRAYGSNLANVLKLMQAQRVYDKSTVDTLMKMAKMYFKNAQLLGHITPYEAGRIMSVLHGAVGKRDVTNDANKLVGILVDAHSKELQGLLDKAAKTKAKKVNASGVEVIGSLDKMGQIALEAYNEAVDLDEKAIEDKLFEAQNDTAHPEEAEARINGLMMAREYVTDIKQKKQEVKDLQALLKEKAKDAREGNMSRRAWMEFRKATEAAIMEDKLGVIDAYHSLIYRMSTDISKASARAKAFQKSVIDHTREIQHFANSDMQGRSASAQGELPTKYNNAVLRGLMSGAPTFQYMLKKFGEKDVDGKGYLYDYFMGAVTKAKDKEFNGKLGNTLLMEAKLEEFFGKKMKIADLYKYMRADGTTLSYREGGEMREIEISQGQMLYIYMLNKMADGRMKLSGMGITGDVVAKMAEELPKELVAFADWVQDDFLTKLREKYNIVHERMFGAPMAAIENYFPIKVNKRSIGSKEDISKDIENDKLSTMTGAIIKRKKNAAPIDLSVDALSALLDHINEMEHWAAFAEFNRDVNTLVNYNHFKNQVMNMSSFRYGSGKTLWENFRKTAQVVSGTYRPEQNTIDKAVLNISKGVTASKIAFRGYTAVKQVLSAPAFWSEASVDNLLFCYVNPKGSCEWAMEFLPGFKERWMGRMMGNEKLLPQDSDWKIWRNNFVKNATRIGMTPNAAVDALTVAQGARAVYLTKLEAYKKAGYTEQRANEKALQAAAEAYNESQQSSMGAYISPIQASGTAMTSLLTTFKNANFGYTRKTAQSLANIKRHTEKGYKEEAIAYMTKKFIREGLTEEQAKKLAERRYKRSLYKDSANVALYGFGLNMLWMLGGSAIYLLAGDDDEKKEELVNEALIRGALGSLDGIPLGETLANWATASMMGEDAQLRMPRLIAVNDFDNIVQIMKSDSVRGAYELANMFIAMGIGVNPATFVDAFMAFADVEEWSAEEVAMLALKILNAPKSQLELLAVDKAMENGGVDATEVMRRYVEQRTKNQAPGLQGLYSDENLQKAWTKNAKRFDRFLDERLENVIEDDFAFRMFYDDADAMTRVKISEMREKYLKGDDKAFVKKELEDVINGVYFGAEKKTVYYGMADENDINEDFELKQMIALLSPVYSEYLKMKDGLQKGNFFNEHKDEIVLYKKLNARKSEMDSMKKYMQDNPGLAEKNMRKIRKLRTEAMNLISGYNE